MKLKTAILFGLTLALITLRVGAQDAPKQPGPEQKKLEAWAGKWTFEEVSLETPLGRAGKNAGTIEGRMILDGFYLENRVQSTGSEGTFASVEIIAYDPDKARYQDSWFGSTGEFDRAWKMENATATVEGDTWNWTWKEEKKGVTYFCRQVTVMASDQRSYTFENTYSEDGNSWKKRSDAKAQKVGDDSRKRPGPEHQKLAMMTGSWIYEEENGISPFGPAGQGTYTWKTWLKGVGRKTQKE